MLIPPHPSLPSLTIQPTPLPQACLSASLHPLPPSLPATLQLQLGSQPRKASMLSFYPLCPRTASLDIKQLPFSWCTPRCPQVKGRCLRLMVVQPRSCWSPSAPALLPETLSLQPHHFSSLLSSPLFLCTFWLLILAESPSLPMDTHIPGKLLFSSYLPRSEVNFLCEDFPFFELIIPFSKLLEPLVYFNTHHMILSSSVRLSVPQQTVFWGWRWLCLEHRGR